MKEVKFLFSKTTVNFFYRLTCTFHTLKSLCLTQVTKAIYALPSYTSFWHLLLNSLHGDKSLYFRYRLKI